MGPLKEYPVQDEIKSSLKCFNTFDSKSHFTQNILYKFVVLCYSWPVLHKGCSGHVAKKVSPNSCFFPTRQLQPGLSKRKIKSHMFGFNFLCYFNNKKIMLIFIFGCKRWNSLVFTDLIKQCFMMIIVVITTIFIVIALFTSYVLSVNSDFWVIE